MTVACGQEARRKGARREIPDQLVEDGLLLEVPPRSRMAAASSAWDWESARPARERLDATGMRRQRRAVAHRVVAPSARAIAARDQRRDPQALPVEVAVVALLGALRGELREQRVRGWASRRCRRVCRSARVRASRIDRPSARRSASEGILRTRRKVSRHCARFR